MICGLGRSERGRCQTVVDGRYATAVTVPYPTTCPVTQEKHFAPLVLTVRPSGVNHRPSKAGPSPSSSLSLAKPRWEDCFALEEAVGGPAGGPLVLGVLDIVADYPLDVTVTNTAGGFTEQIPSIGVRSIIPRCALSIGVGRQPDTHPWRRQTAVSHRRCHPWPSVRRTCGELSGDR